MNNILRKIISKITNIKKKLLGIAVLIISLTVIIFFILENNNIFYSEKIVQKSLNIAQNENQLKFADIIKNNDLKRKNDLSKIEAVLEEYYDENDSYLISENGIKLNDESSEVYSSLRKYISVDNFQDPINPEYYYEYKSNGRFFELSARLENINDVNCKMLNENICIYRIINYGKIVKVLIRNETRSNFLEQISSIDMDENTIIVTGDYLDINDQKIVDMLNLPKSIKTMKIKELSEEDRRINNLILIGNADSNDLIFNMYKKSRVIENVDLIDENNLHVATLKSSRNIWNDEKDILILETGCLADKIVKLTGEITVEQIDEDLYHVSLNASDDKIALVPSSNFISEKSFIDSMSELSETKQEIYGYRKICDFDTISMEDIIAVIGINEIN